MSNGKKKHSGALLKKSPTGITGFVICPPSMYHLHKETFGPIRLDWAYVLDPQPEEKRYQIYFTIGHAF